MTSALLPLNVERWTLDLGRFKAKTTHNAQRSTLNAQRPMGGR